MTSTKGGGIPIHNPEPNMASNRRTNLFTYKTFCLITGGSKGLGRCMAMRFAALLPRDSVMLLLARSTDQLLKSKSLIVESSPGIKVKVIPIDLTNADNEDFDDCLKTTFSEFNMNPGAFEQAVIVHNAASMGDVSKRVEEITDKKMLQDYYSLNLTSMILLNNIFLKHFREDILESRVIINISSICALQPFKTWSTYCSGKCARDMIFRTMALEDDRIRILNYAPGPLDTDMQLVARTKTGDKEVKNLFDSMFAEGRLLTCDQSLDKLVRLLEQNKFDSGAHIDYYDV